MLNIPRPKTAPTPRDEKAEQKLRSVAKSASNLHELVQRNLSVVPDEIDHLIDEYSERKKTANGKH